MKNAVKIMDSEISIKEYKGDYTFTFKDIDMVHRRPDGTLDGILEPTESILLRVWISIKSVPTKFGQAGILSFRH